MNPYGIDLTPTASALRSMNMAKAAIEQAYIHTLSKGFEVIDTPFVDGITCIELTKLNNILVVSKNNGTWIMNIKNHKWHRVNI